MRAVVGATVDDGAWWANARAVDVDGEVWGIVDRARAEARSLVFMRR